MVFFARKWENDFENMFDSAFFLLWRLQDNRFSFEHHYHVLYDLEKVNEACHRSKPPLNAPHFRDQIDIVFPNPLIIVPGIWPFLGDDFSISYERDVTEYEKQEEILCETD